MTRYFLRPDVQIQVLFDDRTPFGSPLSNKLDTAVQGAFSNVLNTIIDAGPIELQRINDSLRAAVARGALDLFVEGMNEQGWTLRPELLFPVVEDGLPRTLVILHPEEDVQATVNVPIEMWPAIHDLVACLVGDGVPRQSDRNWKSFGAELREILETLIKGGLVVSTPRPPWRSYADEVVEHDFTFLGHNTVLAHSGETSLLIDPLFYATSNANPGEYQPLQVGQLPKIDGILITHSHPDHFDPGSLLRLPADVQIVIPACSRETALAVHMEQRLAQFGFRNVVALNWNDELTIGDIRVRAMPFLGEQPTDSLMLHPDVRNVGNTYLVQTPRVSSVFLADSSIDDRGTTWDAVKSSLEDLMPHVVFSGYRGWCLYPFQYLVSSIPRYFLFVPPALWGIRQQGMLTANDAIDTAERLGARVLVPYADGGAPWHWRVGLGPRLDVVDASSETEGFDYLPDRVLRAANHRSTFVDEIPVASPVKIALLRPNQTLSICQTIASHIDPFIVPLPGQSWPFQHFNNV